MLIRSQNVQMNKLTLEDVAFVTDEIDAGMSRSRVRNGDVLLNITGASIGRVAAFELEDVRANVNQHVCIIRPKPEALFTRYVTHLISSREFQAEIDRLQHGGTRQALTFSQIAEFRIPLPPLAEQRRIAEGLALHAGLHRHPSSGYKLAADWAQHFDTRHGNGLNGPSRAKLQKLRRFMLSVEALEEER